MAIPILRDDQRQLKADVHGAWSQGAKNVVMRLDTGGGKTVILSDINREHDGHSRVVAHRQELVSQLSLTLARNGVRHNVVTSDNVRRAIAKAHCEEIGYSLIDGNSRCHVGSVDTMVRRDDPDADKVTLWTVDEAHHLVDGNKWHTLVTKYTRPDCRGLMPTATPKRGDKKGLGRGQGGIADVMVQGPPMRWLIDRGFLSDYRIICPPTDMQMLRDVAASGDWSTKALREAAEQSHIVGDVVLAYLQYGAGKLGITFAPDVKTATEMVLAYRLSGVRAELLTGETDDAVRRSVLRQFSARQVDVIVAVDIISEGFDLPAIEVAQFARPTASLGLYMQQFGRALRVMPGKGKAIILDHVRNVIRHEGPPDRPRIWSLNADGGGSRSVSDSIPYRVCTECTSPYEAVFKACPFCGFVEVPAERSSPKMVAGVMEELSPEVLEALRKNIAAVDMSIPERRAEVAATFLPHMQTMALMNRHYERQMAQGHLRRSMAQWGGVHRANGYTDDMIQRAFYFKFGISVIEACALGTKDAQNLTDKICSVVG